MEHRRKTLKTSNKAPFEHGERLENGELDGASYGLG
jgi:hypothetical protein